MFDGASANQIGGIGVHLLITQDHYFCFKLGFGLSTNTRFELLALWTLLYCDKSMVLPTLHIHGDYIAIINWLNRRSSLTLLALDGWCQCIHDMEPCFIQLKAVHIFREHNTKADSLSKEALTLASGLLQYIEFIDGECTDQGTFQLL